MTDTTTAPDPETPVLDLEAIAALRADGFKLIKTHGDPTTGEGCAADLIAWKTTGDITDMPPCVHSVFARQIQRINDDKATSEGDMWRLVEEVGPLVVGSIGWPVLDVLRVSCRVGMTVDGFLAALAQRANLRGANLRGAYLSGADLSGAYLRSANLRGADLSSADLSSANLRGADLSGAYLRSANLSGVDLSSADLSSANLRGADLRGAYLSGADLSGAYLRSANLSGVDLSSAYGSASTVLPSGWKVNEAGLVVPE